MQKRRKGACQTKSGHFGNGLCGGERTVHSTEKFSAFRGVKVPKNIQALKYISMDVQVSDQ